MVGHTVQSWNKAVLRYISGLSGHFQSRPAGYEKSPCPAGTTIAILDYEDRLVSG